jgi:hypothetical protein
MVATLCTLMLLGAGAWEIYYRFQRESRQPGDVAVDRMVGPRRGRAVLHLMDEARVRRPPASAAAAAGGGPAALAVPDRVAHGSVVADARAGSAAGGRVDLAGIANHRQWEQIQELIALNWALKLLVLFGAAYASNVYLLLSITAARPGTRLSPVLWRWRFGLDLLIALALFFMPPVLPR